MEYVAVLKKMMATCKHDVTEYKNRLQDRFLRGCNDREMQRVIIDVGERLTYEDAIRAALQCEARQQSLKELSPGSSIVKQAKCRFKAAKYHNCQQTGHIRRCCPTSEGATDRRTLDEQRDEKRRETGPGYAKNAPARNWSGRRGSGSGSGRGCGHRCRGNPKQHCVANVAKSSSEEQYYEPNYDETTCDKMSELYVDKKYVSGADYKDMSNKLSSLYVGRDVKCGSPRSCDYFTPKLPGVDDTGNDEVHLGVHALNNTKLKESRASKRGKTLSCRDEYRR